METFHEFYYKSKLPRNTPDYKVQNATKRNVVIIVSQPNDEILWAGGIILKHQKAWNWHIICLCQRQNEEGISKFKKALKALKVNGAIMSLDDGTEIKTSNQKILEKAIIQNLPPCEIDLIITHNPKREHAGYTKDIGKAVITLWQNGTIRTRSLWCFAYQDKSQSFYPRAIIGADFYYPLHELVVRVKHRLLNEIYGIGLESPEIFTCPASEAFWSFTNSSKAFNWLNKQNNKVMKHT
tara:strand:+ start:51119 stop:51835 length:717 start_codon:yes stop_codon:yes gene_type:complete